MTARAVAVAARQMVGVLWQSWRDNQNVPDKRDTGRAFWNGYSIGRKQAARQLAYAIGAWDPAKADPSSPPRENPDMTKRFDPVAGWASLDPEQREKVGIAALALVSAQAYEDAHPMEDTPGVVAETGEAAVAALLEVLLEIRPDAPEAPPLVDGAHFGILSCRICGCTERHACPEGCGWATADTCTACVAKAMA